MDASGVSGDRRPRRRVGRRPAARDRPLAGRAARARRRVRRARLRRRGRATSAFGETEAARLRDGVAAGARGLKVWKLLGLRARDPRGPAGRGGRPAPRPAVGGGRRARRPGDDPRRRPDRVLRAARRANERWEELRAHPDWHFWPTRPAGRAGRAGLPALRRADRRARGGRGPPPGHHVHRRPRRLRRGGPGAGRQPSSSARRNFHVDIAARIAELGPPAPHGARVHPALGRPRRVRDRHASRSRRRGRSTTASSRRPTSRSPTTPTRTPYPARADGGSTVSTCPTTSCAPSTTTTPRA